VFCAGEYGPAWLEHSFDDVDEPAESYKAAAAAAQLEKEGLAFRKRRLFTATRRSRWEALEIQVGVVYILLYLLCNDVNILYVMLLFLLDLFKHPQ
jgi:hypothetical protein